jgi:integrase/recombinase XerD
VAGGGGGVIVLVTRSQFATLRMPYRFERGKLRPWVYYCLFGLLSVSGLRLGEARNLEL